MAPAGRASSLSITPSAVPVPLGPRPVSQYEPPMPMKALSWLMPMVIRDMRCRIGFPAVLTRIGSPVSNEKLPETSTNSLIWTVTLPAARISRLLKSRSMTSLAPGPVETGSLPAMSAVPSLFVSTPCEKSTTCGLVDIGVESLDSLSSRVSCRAKARKASMPTNSTLPLAFSAV